MRPLCVRRCSCRSTYTIEIDSPSAAFSFDRGAGAAIAFLCPWYPGTVGFLPSWRPRTRVPWYKFEVDRTGLQILTRVGIPSTSPIKVPRVGT
eukprot:240670-Rhodomonas_salina.3